MTPPQHDGRFVLFAESNTNVGPVPLIEPSKDDTDASTRDAAAHARLEVPSKDDTDAGADADAHRDAASQDNANAAAHARLEVPSKDDTDADERRDTPLFDDDEQRAVQGPTLRKRGRPAARPRATPQYGDSDDGDDDDDENDKRTAIRRQQRQQAVRESTVRKRVRPACPTPQYNDDNDVSNNNNDDDDSTPTRRRERTTRFAPESETNSQRMNAARDRARRDVESHRVANERALDDIDNRAERRRTNAAQNAERRALQTPAQRDAVRAARRRNNVERFDRAAAVEDNDADIDEDERAAASDDERDEPAAAVGERSDEDDGAIDDAAIAANFDADDEQEVDVNNNENVDDEDDEEDVPDYEENDANMRPLLAAHAKGDPFPAATSAATTKQAFDAFTERERERVSRPMSACVSCALRVWPQDCTLVSLDFAGLRMLTPTARQAPIAEQYENAVPSNVLPPGLMTCVDAMANASGDKATRELATHAVVCTKCYNALSASKLPQASLANDNATGRVPLELQNLTLAERRAICLVVMNASILRCSLESTQRKMHGHAVYFRSQPIDFSLFVPATELPLPRDRLDVLAFVVFSSNLTSAAKVLAMKEYEVRVDKVHAALKWLCAHNPLYKDVVINEANIAALAVAPVCVVPPEVVNDLNAANEDDQSIAPRGEGVAIGGGGIVAAIDVHGNAVAIDSADAALQYTRSESAAMAAEEVPSAGDATNLLREQVERLVNSKFFFACFCFVFCVFVFCLP